MPSFENLKNEDIEVYDAVMKELNRQRNKIELIASENFVSPAVMEAMGSYLTNKYAEGYPGNRYYGGCEYVDVIENLARKSYLMQNMPMFNHTLVHKLTWLFIQLYYNLEILF